MARILLIEPDMLTAGNIRDFLQKQGHSVQWRSDAQAAINSAGEAAPELVIMEMQLSTHSGMEFLYEFRSYPGWHNTPIIVLSSLSEGEIGTSSIMWQELEVVSYRDKSHTSLEALSVAVTQALQLTRS